MLLRMAPSLLVVVHATRGGWAPHVIKNLNQGGSGWWEDYRL